MTTFEHGVEEPSAVDVEIEQAWSRFRAALANDLVGKQPGYAVGFVATREFCAQAGAAGVLIERTARSLTVTASVRTARNTTVLFRGPVVDVLDAVGVVGSSPKARIRRREFPVTFVDGAAATLVRIFREGLGVPHPIYLSTPHQGLPFAGRPARQGIDPGEDIEIVDCGEHLEMLVGETLRAAYGSAVRDCPHGFDLDDEVCRVRCLIDPVRMSVRIATAVVSDVADERAAHELCRQLNATGHWMRFDVVKRSVRLRSELPARLFVPQRLLETVGAMHDYQVDHAADLVQSLGGRLPYLPWTRRR